MIPLQNNPTNFIVDLNNMPYVIDRSPIAAGSRKYQAYIFAALGLISFIACIFVMPIFLFLAVPMLAYSAYLLYTRNILTFHESYAEVFSKDFLNDPKTVSLFYQNYEGVQVGTRPAKGNTPPFYTITMVHEDPSLNLPLLDLPDSKRAYQLAELYANMMDVNLLPARAFAS